MRRAIRHIVLAVLLAFPTLLRAQEKLGIGVEWGLGYLPMHYIEESFRTDALYRIDREGWKGSQHINGFASFALEYDLSKRQTLSLTLGKRGVGSGDRIYPLGLRYARFHNGHAADTGWFFAEVGVAYNRDAAVHKAAQGLLGYGWRYRLGGHSFFDGGIRLAAVVYHPDLIDPDTEGIVPERHVFSNSRVDTFLELFIAIRLR